MLRHSKIVALDASTTKTGWCFFKDDVYVESGIYKTKARGFEAVFDYSLFLENLLKRCNPGIIFYERPSGGQGRNKWVDLLLGALWYQTWLLTGEKLILVSPMEIKKTGIYKNASREDLVKFLALLGLDRFDFDEVDSLGCFLAGMKKLGIYSRYSQINT